MYSRKPTLSPVETTQLSVFDPSSYQAQLKTKLRKLHNLVESNLTQAVQEHKRSYDRHSAVCSFKVGDLVWLSVPTAGKLSRRWEGKWIVNAVPSRVSVELNLHGA